MRTHPRTGASEVRGWDRHVSRFRSAVAEALAGDAGSLRDAVSPLEIDLDAFLESAAQAIAAAGEGFPRLELLAAEPMGAPHASHAPEPQQAPARPATSPAPRSRLAFRIRPLPPLRDTIELRTAAGFSPASPMLKGPNIASFAELNQRLGAEALLLDSAGDALEGATTSLIWWTASGGHVVADANRVPSVTEAILRAAAPLLPGTVSVEELTRYEVWAVNALHGIRVVTAIDGARTAAPEPDRLARFRDVLDRAWQPVGGI